MPLPDEGFEPSEAAVSWRKLRDAGATVVIATERGGVAPKADLLRLPELLFKSLNTTREVLELYEEMTRAPEFVQPVSWSSLDLTAFDALVLPGGHAPGMRQYLESRSLQEQVATFWKLGRPVGAICHGPVVLVRSIHRPARACSAGAGRRRCRSTWSSARSR